MRNPSRPFPNPNLTQPTTPEVANTNPSLRDLETMSLGEYVKAKIAHGMGKRATVRAEKMVDARLDLVEQQEAAGLPVHDSQGMFRRDNRDALVAQYVTDKDNERKYKREKRKYVLSRIGSAAMWVPGVDIVGSLIQESVAARKIDKKIRRGHQASNGGSGFLSPFLKIRNAEKNRFAKQKAGLDEKKRQILHSRQEWGNL